MFELLGLSAIDETVYHALVRAPSSDVAMLAAAVELSLPEVERALGALNELGLVSWQPGNPAVIAAPPDVALPLLVEQHQHDLDVLRVSMSRVIDEYRTHQPRDVVAQVVEPVVGVAAIRQRFRQLQAGATSEVRALVRPPFAEPLTDNGAGMELLERGVACRAIFDKRTLEMPGGLLHLQQRVNAGEQAAMLSYVPVKVTIFDDRYALMPLTADPSTHDVSLLVRESTLLTAMIELFELLWPRATTIHASDPDGANRGLADRDAQLLSMLVAGMTDTAVGRALGLSGRTVQRRVAALCHAFGVRSRLDLMLLAAREQASSHSEPAALTDT